MKKISLFSVLLLSLLIALGGMCLTACSDDADLLVKAPQPEAHSDTPDEASTRTAPANFKTNWENATELVLSGGKKSTHLGPMVAVAIILMNI